MKATDLISKILTKTGSAREQAITDVISQPNAIPDFLTHFAVVEVTLGSDTLQYFVSKEYFSVGEDDDYLVTPVFPLTLKPLLLKMNCSLPTPKMVDQIYQHAQIKIPAHPQQAHPGESMTGTRLYLEIDKAIKKERAKLGAGLDALVAGHKKDVVLTNTLTNPANKGHIAIYGWFYANGTKIQGLNPKDHSISYVDYSHGFRLVSNACKLNDNETTLQAIWNDPKLCHLIHDEPLRFQSY